MAALLLFPFLNYDLHHAASHELRFFSFASQISQMERGSLESDLQLHCIENCEFDTWTLVCKHRFRGPHAVNKLFASFCQHLITSHNVLSLVGFSPLSRIVCHVIGWIRQGGTGLMTISESQTGQS
jgi:hypothetical protein